MHKNKAFTLVELLVVIAIIGLLSTVVLITTKGLKDRAIETRKLSNRRQAKIYCTANPGFTILKAPNAQGVEKDYRVYCDNRGNMWTETLHTDFNSEAAGWYGDGTLNVKQNTFLWSTPTDIDIVTTYGINDCNEIKKEDLYKFPACNACATLNYAGFAEGWQLPSQRKDTYNIKTTSSTSCDVYCARNPENQAYCGVGRQLWDFGLENCTNWNTTSCASPGQDPCNYEKDKHEGTKWDRKAQTSTYWSSTQYSGTPAWTVRFHSAGVGSNTKSTNALSVRCFLGSWP